MHRCILIIMVLTALAVALPAPLQAADDQAHNASNGKILGEESGLFVGAVELSLWTILVFVILLFVLRKYAWGPILSGLQQREEGIARDKREAEHARREAAEAKAKVEAELARVNAEISQMISKARQDAQATAAEELARGKTEVQAERNRLQRELIMERDQALQEIWSKSVQLATLISTKAIGKQLGYDDHRALLDEALGEFRAAAQSRLADLQSAHA
jgi:F-type H+-transporting ATPase subunit b